MEKIPAPLEYTIQGDRQSSTLVFFVHGWPDGPVVWDRMIDRLKGEVLCVNITLPGFEQDFARRRAWFTKMLRPLGPSFPEQLALVEQTMKKIAREHEDKTRALVSHDWGSVFGHMLLSRNESFFNGGSVWTDVNMSGPSPWSLKTLFLFSAYQLCNVFLLVLLRLWDVFLLALGVCELQISEAQKLRFEEQYGAVIECFYATTGLIWPAEKRGNLPVSRFAGRKLWMVRGASLYAQGWWHILYVNTSDLIKKIPVLGPMAARVCLPSDEQIVPHLSFLRSARVQKPSSDVLYLYGKLQKPFYFHDPAVMREWEASAGKTSYFAWKGFNNSDHWPMDGPEFEAYLACVQEFLARGEAKVGAMRARGEIKVGVEGAGGG